MPMPKVKAGEDKDKFIKRCMGDEVMVEEYPDEEQRYAICNDLWQKRKKRSILEERAYTFEVRMEESEEAPKIVGYAAVYNELSGDLGGFREKIKRGFFKPAIGRDDVRALFNHDENMVLGRTKNDTLILEEDRKGLKVEITPPDTSYARDLMNLIKRGDVDQMSFQWITAKDSWDESDLNNVVRTLEEIKELWDVSPVAFPAYQQTKAMVRSKREIYINHLEELLEDKSSDEEISKDETWKDKISIAKKKLMIVEKEI